MTRLAAALGALLLTTACAEGDGHNDADVEFATEMIGHHADAIQMANYTIGRESLDPEFADLAEQIRVAHTEELDTRSGWLRDWDEPVPETGFATGDGHTHEEQDHGADMETLAEASDADFEGLWLAQMREHHEGAVSLAEDVLDDGDSPDVADLARVIRTAQQTEIERMEALAG